MKLIAVIALMLAAPSAWAIRETTVIDNRPVTQDQFKQLLRVFKNVVDRFDKMDARMQKLEGGTPAVSTPSTDGAVSLDQLDAQTETHPSTSAPQGGSSPHGTSTAHSPHGGATPGGGPSFKVYFDLNFYNRPGTANELTFDTFHALFMGEMMPIPEMQFAFDISGGTAPRWYELDYQIHPKLQLRAGRIWIPFDDMAPHNIFGGRVNVSKLAVTSDQFLPDLWTDLGVGAKITAVDTPKFALTVDGYVVNGFNGTGTDRRTGQSNAYPNFTSIGITDNNRNKAFGGRVASRFFGILGVGVSGYYGRYTAQAQDSKTMLILGADSQLRLPFGLDLRAGLASMNVPLISGDTAKRMGYYGEAGYSFGPRRQFKVLGRGGGVQLDDRVIAASDQAIVGGTLVWRPGMIEISLEHSRDLNRTPDKHTYTFTNLRLVVAL